MDLLKLHGSYECCSAAYARLPFLSILSRLTFQGCLFLSAFAFAFAFALPSQSIAAPSALVDQAPRPAMAAAGGLTASGADRAILSLVASNAEQAVVTPVRPVTVRQILESGANMQAVDDVVYVAGKIEPNQDARLREMALVMGRGGMAPALVVFLANEGGHLGAAMRMGRLIRQLGANTAVTGICASACIYAFAGGSRRVGTPDSRFGLHPARRADGRGGTVAEDEQVALLRYEYLEEMGVDANLVTWEGELAANQVYWLTAGEAQAVKLTNLLVAAEEIPLPPGD